MSDLENRQLPQIDEEIMRELEKLDEAKQQQIDLEHAYREVMTERLKAEQEKIQLKIASDRYSNMVEEEIKELKRQMEECDAKIMEVKQDRQDLLDHIKMSNKVKRSKNAKEIQEGQTLIFESKKKGGGGNAKRK